MPVIEGEATLIEWRELAPEIRHFVFEAPEPLLFAAGQFVSFSRIFQGKSVTRAYSIVSVPDGRRFDLCLNLVRDGIFSPYLFGLDPGARVHMKGPYGAFTFRSPATDAVLIATGTGIAPIRSMLLDRLPNDSGNRYTLLFGVRYEHGILYREDFELLAREHANFRFWPTLTRPPAEWTGRTGRIQAHLDDAIGDRRDLQIYVCGLKCMVDEVRTIAKALGFDRRQIVYEKYD
jgi:CDP-4-dehydro-6-deoxyglucose reductase